MGELGNFYGYFFIDRPESGKVIEISLCRIEMLKNINRFSNFFIYKIDKVEEYVNGI